MKKLMMVMVVALLTTTVNAQSEKYTTQMKASIAQMDTARTPQAYADLASKFERIADAEKTQWLPYYYAAVCKVNGTNMALTGEMGDNSAVTDPAADKAQELLDKALILEKENSETWVLKKMIYSLRMMGNPMARFMEWGGKAATALATAKKLDATNPRIPMLEGIDKYYTPEQFGGSKKEAKKLLENAKALYIAFKPATSLHPTWGMGQVMYFLSLPE